MNAKKQTIKSPRQQNQAKRVHIEFSSGSACKVCVAGTFNNWNPEKSRMKRVRNGTWAKDLLLKPGAYEYRLVVDGAWQSDPNAERAVANPFGESNSLLTVNP
jgi:1,4-alpha-glucan branching enzyme